MSRSARWVSKALLTFVATSIVVTSLGEAAHAGVAPSTPAGAPVVVAGTVPTAEAGAYTVEFAPDGTMTLRTTNPALAATVGSPAADEVAPMATWSYTFSRDLTNRLWNAFVTGASGTAGAICVLVAPPWVDPFCSFVAAAIFQFLDRLGNPNGRCLQVSVSTRLGIPPVSVSVRYVTCTS